MTNSKGYLVNRNYEDFVDLKKEMKRIYPGHRIPRLEEPLVSTPNPEMISKHIKRMQNFIDELSKNVLLMSSPLFSHFISEADSNKYDEYKKEVKNVITPTDISDFYTLDGIAVVSFDSKLEDECKKIQEQTKLLYKSFEK